MKANQNNWEGANKTCLILMIDFTESDWNSDQPTYWQFKKAKTHLLVYAQVLIQYCASKNFLNAKKSMNIQVNA